MSIRSWEEGRNSRGVALLGRSRCRVAQFFRIIKCDKHDKLTRAMPCHNASRSYLLFYFVSGHVLGKTRKGRLQCACIQARWTEEIKVSIEINGKLQLVPMHMGAVGVAALN